MNSMDRSDHGPGLSSSEKNILFGVLLGVVVGQFIHAFQSVPKQSSQVVTRHVSGG